MSGEQHPTFIHPTNQKLFAVFKAALDPKKCRLTDEDEDEDEIKREVKEVINIPSNSNQKHNLSNSAIIGFYAGFLNIESEIVRDYAKKNKKMILDALKKKKIKTVHLLRLTHGAMRWLWFFHPHDKCDDVTFVGWYRVTAEEPLARLEAIEAKKTPNHDLFDLQTPIHIKDCEKRDMFIELLLTAQDYRPKEITRIKTMMTQLRVLISELQRNLDAAQKRKNKGKTEGYWKKLEKVEHLYLLLYYYSNLVQKLTSTQLLTQSV